MTGSKNANDALPGTPDTLLNAGNDAKIELSDADLNNVTGGSGPKPEHDEGAAGCDQQCGVDWPKGR